MKLNLTPEQFEELEKEILAGLNDIAPALAVWLYSHPKAKNYLKLRFEGKFRNGGDGENGEFMLIIQKPTPKLASCPFCHGTEE